jgi:hypothetical protein
MDNSSFYVVVNPYLIMVITKKGILKSLHCPFKVVCIYPVDEIRYNSICYVYKVREIGYNMIYYTINGKEYPHSHFCIIAVL